MYVVQLNIEIPDTNKPGSFKKRQIAEAKKLAEKHEKPVLEDLITKDKPKDIRKASIVEKDDSVKREDGYM